MHSLEQIERGNNAVVLQQAQRLLLSNGAVLVTYEGLAAMDARGRLTEAEAVADAEAFVKAEIGRTAKVLTPSRERTFH